MAGTQKQQAKGFCSPSGEERYCSVRKQNFSKSRWREKVPICPTVPHFQSGTVCPAVTAEGKRHRYLLDGEFGSKVLGGACGRMGREVRPWCQGFGIGNASLRQADSRSWRSSADDDSAWVLRRCPQISGAARRGGGTLCKRGKMRPPFSFFKKRMRRARCKRKRETRLYENIG